MIVSFWLLSSGQYWRGWSGGLISIFPPTTENAGDGVFDNLDAILSFGGAGVAIAIFLRGWFQTDVMARRWSSKTEADNLRLRSELSRYVERYGVLPPDNEQHKER